MADNITRCPKCQTSFRINAAHLNSASGAVRCGSCLNVFNAKEHLIQPPPSEKPTASRAATKPAPSPSPSPLIDEDDDQLISDDMEDNISDTAVHTLEDNDNEAFSSEFSRTLRDNDLSRSNVNLFEREFIPEDNDEIDTSADDSWALNLLDDEEEDEDDEVRDEAPVKPQKPAQPARRPPPKPTFEPVADDDQADFQPTFHIVDDSEPAADQAAGGGQLGRELFDDDYHSGSYPAIDSPAPKKSSHYLDAIEPEPVEFAWRVHRPMWSSRWLWGASSALAALLLLAQLAWLQFDQYSRIEPYRTYYALACGQLGCTLPDLADRAKIRTANLVVHSHPRVKGALVVDAVLQNTARFPQTFPALELVFTDSSDRVVAARRLEPKEYLGGELAGHTHMPVNKPIHIAIEIVDPGPKAVGYKISTLAN